MTDLDTATILPRSRCASESLDKNFVKDLSLLNRNLRHSIIVDNSPVSYKFHPENAIDCTSFVDDPDDVEMWQIADFLTSIKAVDDVRPHCRSWREWCEKNWSIERINHDRL